ncbi:MAG: hypothetical protein C4B59_04720 [Candidatus Methanogaster sp.]|uniref:Uncharacterized protein n=1 Tax=Candidatus Methanogaster sp. TaxID=3386292 RepID=A0AC61L4I4_9EURY|nr:MAG: hypothetical protein C4B59_04720 [ANME-2 cluster archaeon]
MTSIVSSYSIHSQKPEDVSLVIQPESVEDVLRKPDEGDLQVRFCEGVHSNLGAIISKKGVLWALLDISLITTI